MYDYLNDMDFLIKLDKARLKTQYVKIILLSFDKENTIGEIQGSISSGSISVNGSSAVRRTINLSMLADIENSDIEDVNLDKTITINKKIKIEIGLKNPFRSYENYGDIIWFPCGLYVISSANIQRSTSGWQISITAKDKMCLLDGSAGGTLPALVTFHKKYIELENGEIEIQYPTIFQIIQEAVNHWGGEAMENIVVDVDQHVKLLVKYMGDSPIYFSDNYANLDFSPSDDYPYMYSYGDNTGYELTDFTYPGELVLQPGETVVSLLDKIVSVLGNYEYFYTVDGKFVFQEIKNYLNTGSPLEELDTDDYVQSYNNAKFLYNLTDLDTTTAITRTPKYDQIKNDFYVWGVRTSPAGAEIPIRYHLAIDGRPRIDLANKYMWEIKQNNTLIRYDFTTYNNYSIDGYDVKLFASPCDEWREELYRRAIVAQVTNSVYDNYYDSELIAKWRKLYDPDKSEWSSTNHWNPDVYNNPEKLDFWLDIIDSGAEIGKYSINQIGRRTKVVNSSDLKSIYNRQVPDILFLQKSEATQDVLERLNAYGQKYFILTPEYYDLFHASSTGASCFDKIRELLYQHLSYNTTIQLTCLPKYYMVALDVNNIIYISDEDSHINGNYQITQFTLPLTYNGTMNITATEVLTRV